MTGVQARVSRPAGYAGRHPLSHQAPSGLVPGEPHAPGFDSNCLLSFASTGVNKPTNAGMNCADARSSGAMPRGRTKNPVLRGAATVSRTVAPKKQRIALEPNLSQEIWKFL
jgi:hypothetical protein